jgi:hypothetical protein
MKRFLDEISSEYLAAVAVNEMIEPRRLTLVLYLDNAPVHVSRLNPRGSEPSAVEESLRDLSPPSAILATDAYRTWGRQSTVRPADKPN